MAPKAARNDLHSVSLDIGGSIVEIPIIAAPYFLGGLPDLVDVPKITARTDPAAPPLARQIHDQDTSAKSLANWTDQDIAWAASVVASTTYHSAWPDDPAYRTLYNTARQSASTVLKKAIAAERRPNAQSGVSSFATSFFPLAAIWGWFGFGLGIDFATEWLGVVVSLGSVLFGWLVIGFSVLCLDLALPRERRIRLAFQVVLALLLAVSIVSGTARDIQFEVRSWTMEI